MRSDPAADVAVQPVPAVSVAVFRGGAVLLVQRMQPPMQGVWSLPGGHIEPGEPAAVAALRELAEETGVAAQLHGPADVVDVILRDPAGALLRHYVITVFAASWTAGEPLAASDSAAARFVPLADIASLHTTPGLLPAITRAERLTARA